MNGLSLGPTPVRAASGLLLLSLTLCGTGCSDNKPVTVNGSVSYRGEAIPAAIVKFYGSGDHSAMAYVRDGAFIVTDLPLGEVKATVEPDDSQRKGAGAARGGTSVVIPRKYADPNTSGLVFSITAATKKLDLKLD
jgi:hypothetical protein